MCHEGLTREFIMKKFTKFDCAKKKTLLGVVFTKKT